MKNSKATFRDAQILRQARAARRAEAKAEEKGNPALDAYQTACAARDLLEQAHMLMYEAAAMAPQTAGLADYLEYARRMESILTEDHGETGLRTLLAIIARHPAINR